jgi:DNA-directed RNA polymerase subunit RPC12/RpoP
MSFLIPTYFCDHCGHAFTHPKNNGRGRIVVNDRDEEDNDERCPRCGNPDFELLTSEENAGMDTTGNKLARYCAVCVFVI